MQAGLNTHVIRAFWTGLRTGGRCFTSAATTLFRSVAFWACLAWAASFPLFGQAFPVQSSVAAIPLAPTPAKSVASATADQDSCEMLQRRSSVLLATRDYAGVTNVLQTALGACTDHRAVLLALAKAQMLSRQFDRALASLNTLLTANPVDADALMTQGEVYYLASQYLDAKGSLQAAISAAPTEAEPHYLLGRLYYSQSNVKDATAEFQEALKLNAKSYKSYDGLGLCYENQGEIELAAQSYMKGIALVYKDYPSYDTIYADFAEYLLRYGKNQKAFDLAAEAASRNPKEPRNFFLAGKALYKAGHLEQSLTWLGKAVAMDRNYPDPHYVLGQAYTKLGNKDEAGREIAAFQKLSQIKTNAAR